MQKGNVYVCGKERIQGYLGVEERDEDVNVEVDDDGNDGADEAVDSDIEANEETSDELEDERNDRTDSEADVGEEREDRAVDCNACDVNDSAQREEDALQAMCQAHDPDATAKEYSRQ